MPMHIVFKLLIGIVIVLGGILIFAPKNEGNRIQGSRPSTAHTYYYYPKANFYYDSTDGNYVIWDSSELTWKQTNQLPLQQEDLGKRVRIGESTEPVWTENEHHKLIYSVSLYSVPKDFKKKERPVTPTSKEKQDTLTAAEQAKKKSGVKKFFEKIFPPKKKKDS